MDVRRGHARNSRSRGRLAALVVVAVALVMAACSSSPSDPAPPATLAVRPVVAATTDVVASLLEALAADGAEIAPLLLRGQVATTDRPSAGALDQVARADLVVAVGAGWEPWLADLGARRTLEVAPLLNPIPLGGSELDGAAGAAGAVDPRFWLDPDRTTQAARRLADELVALGLDRAEVDARADALADALMAADETAQDLLAPVPEDRRTLLAVEAHPAYLADRYGFTVVREPDGPSAATATEVVDAAHARITADATAPTGGAAAVVLHLDALAPAGIPADVPALVEANAHALAAALTADAAG